MTFDLDQAAADIRDAFKDDKYPADTDLSVARFTAERALRAYGCPDEQAAVIGRMIYWAAHNVANASFNRAYGIDALPQFDMMAMSKREVAA